MIWIVVTILLILTIVCFILYLNTRKQLKIKLKNYLSQKEEEFNQELNRQYRERIEDIKKLEQEEEIKKIKLKELEKYTRSQYESMELIIKTKEKFIDEQIVKYEKERKIETETQLQNYQKNLKEELDKEINKINESIKLLKNEEENVKNELDDFRKRREVINKEILRQKEIMEQKDFYRIVLTEADIEDINTLSNIAPRMKRQEIIPKLIWDAIVSRPTNEMIKRVNWGTGGIYKITYIPTGEMYIGKTTDFKNRWKNHIQTALGLEKAASSTLHTHMARNGIWNYTFEILENIPKEKQTEREKYWIEFYESNKYGLNQKIG